MPGNLKVVLRVYACIKHHLQAQLSGGYDGTVFDVYDECRLINNHRISPCNIGRRRGGIYSPALLDHTPLPVIYEDP